MGVGAGRPDAQEQELQRRRPAQVVGGAQDARQCLGQRLHHFRRAAEAQPVKLVAKPVSSIALQRRQEGGPQGVGPNRAEMRWGGSRCGRGLGDALPLPCQGLRRLLPERGPAIGVDPCRPEDHAPLADRERPRSPGPSTLRAAAAGHHLGNPLSHGGSDERREQPILLAVMGEALDAVGRLRDDDFRAAGAADSGPEAERSGQSLAIGGRGDGAEADPLEHRRDLGWSIFRDRRAREAQLGERWQRLTQGLLQGQKSRLASGSWLGRGGRRRSGWGQGGRGIEVEKWRLRVPRRQQGGRAPFLGGSR